MPCLWFSTCDDKFIEQPGFDFTPICDSFFGVSMKPFMTGKILSHKNNDFIIAQI
jgi:hypothetical protein